MCFASNVTSATSKNMQPSRETACNPGRAVGLPQELRHPPCLFLVFIPPV